MLKIYLFSVISFISILSSSVEVGVDAQKNVEGIDEIITIESFGTSWGYTFKLYGFYEGTGTADVVPITPKAASVLQGLDKQEKIQL